MTTIDWNGLTADPGSEAAVDAVTALVTGFDPQVPAVLLPVRVETRFTTTEMPDAVDHIQDLLNALQDAATILQRLQTRQYATAPTGTVKAKKAYKQTVEAPLYAATEADLAGLAAAQQAAATAASQPITAGTPDQIARLRSLGAGIRRADSAAVTALSGLRSPYQRQRLTGLLTDRTTALEATLTAVDQRVLSTLQLVADLGAEPGTQVARRLGRTPDGRPLRPGLTAEHHPTGTPPTRVIIADGTTSTAAVGATRLVPLPAARLVAAAEAADLVRRRLDDPTAALDAAVQAAAADITVLPGSVKADLLARLDAAAGRPGAAAVRAEIAATPSDRADLDTTVTPAAAGTVYVLQSAVRTVHQLLVRIYPEPLAVDTHEDGLTETEQADGATFWSETAAAGADPVHRLGAWRALCIGRSTRRAAWIARVTEPAADLGPTPGARAAGRITDAQTVLTKRLADLHGTQPPAPAIAAKTPAPSPARSLTGGPRIPLPHPPPPQPPHPLPHPLPPHPLPKPVLTAAQRTGIEKALTGVETAVGAAVALPAAAAVAIAARLTGQQAAVTALTTAFLGVPAAWSQRLADLAATVDRIPVEQPPQPETPPVGTRSGTWTRAASSTVLPDRFAVLTLTGSRVGHLAAGGRIPDDLKISFDPSGDTFSLDADGNLVVPDSIRWLADYDEAVTKGMAVTLTITPDEATTGFDELLVLGLADGDAAAGATRITAMLDAHHYTADGLSLLANGTPTNNTEDRRAGYSSTDDPDAAYPIERGDPLAGPGSDADRLAAALGIEAAVFDHVAGADGTDVQQALTANRALYPGTLGHGLEELTGGLVSRDGRERLRTYAIANVTGRGLLPAIRVADEPYGFLPAVALSLFRPDLRDSGATALPAADQARQQRFEDVLLALFRQLQTDWTAMRTGTDGGPAVKHAHSPDIGQPGFDAQQHFLAMLGLEPRSVTSSYRFAVNVADRGGVRGRPALNLSFGVPNAAGTTTDTTARFGPFALMEHLEQVLRLGFQPPAGSALRDPDTGVASPAWQPIYQAIAGSRAYELRLLTGLHPLRGPVATADGGDHRSTAYRLQQLLGLSAADLRARAVQPGLDGVSLTELLVRQALLAEQRRVAAVILADAGLLTEAALALLGTSGLYQTWSGGTLSQTSAWSLLFGRIDDLVRLGGPDGATVPGHLANRTMADYLAGTVQPGDSAAVAAITEHRAAVDALAELPADRIAAVTAEHLDLCSYRLDAWLTGLAVRRLQAMRRARAGGSQLGAYGWVENLRPAATGTPATDVPTALAGRPGQPLTADPTGEGFIQTPSAGHAVTAAVLRSAYRSQITEGSFGNEMSVNLSSSRVRTALGLIDGVRAGNDLGALLGYQLERFLHEYYARPDTPQLTELDSTIFPLRRAYPTAAQVDPGAAAASEPTRSVVDGLALVRSVLDWIDTFAAGATGTLFQTLTGRLAGYPWGTRSGALPPLTDQAKLLGVLQGIDAIADALDALGDLVTSETVHQLVRGNHTRAAAVLAALTEGTAIPRPQVVDTPRTGLPVSHRLLLQLPAVAADPVSSPPGWEAVPMTPAAAAEPAVNAWLAGLLGDPATLRIRLDSDRRPPGSALPEVSVARLGLQPLDLVSMLAQGFDAAVGVLTGRVLDQLHPADLPPDQPGVVTSDGPQTTATDSWRIESARAAAWGPNLRSITDVAPLLEAAADLLGKARAATAEDYAAPESTATTGTGVDLADLSTRIDRLVAGAGAAAVALARLLAADPGLDDTVLDTDPAAWLAGLAGRPGADDLPSVWLPHLDFSSPGLDAADVTAALARLDTFWADRETWRSAVLAAAAYGVRAPLPRRYLSRSQVATELLQAAESAYVELAGRCRAAAASLGGQPDTVSAARWIQAAHDLLGENAVVVPRAGMDPVRAELTEALAADLVDTGEVDSWLEGAAAVRPGAALLSDLQLLAETVGRPALPGRVAQLPFVAGEPWLGGPLPDPAALSGRTSLVIFGADAVPAAGATGTALLVDSWSETVPYREETTAVALHYDQPDATAPQAALVVVPPELGRPWRLADLAATLHDTLEIARNRTVELEHVGAGRYGQLLPLLVGEVIPDAVGGQVAGDRVVLDFEQNNP